MAARRKTAFDRYVAKRMKSPSFAKAYRQADAEISAVDALVQFLETERARQRISKAELAKRAGMPAETVRKLLTSAGANPEVNTISRLAAPLGYELTLRRA